MATSVKIRPPAVAGSFYPATAHELRYAVKALLQAARPDFSEVPKALIVPHAGYVYSGPIAATAYKLLERGHGAIRRVVLLGPSHRVPFRGLAFSSADFFRTPLGDIALDTAAPARVADLPQVCVLDAAHAQEHSLEVHLPFLQETLGDFILIPIVVGDAGPREVAAVLARLANDATTLIVVSSDLSHYLEYDAARTLDATTAAMIEQGAVTPLDPKDACGAHPVNGLLAYAAATGLAITRLDLRNSGDTAGTKDRVVGYGAWALWAKP